MKLTYVSNVRLPTEKAHGVQICKMCEAFSEMGLDVQLLHPHRVQSNPLLKNRSIEDFYLIDRSFSVETLPNVDVVYFLNLIRAPRILELFVTVIHAFFWARYATHIAWKRNVDLVFTRDIPVAWWAGRAGMPIALEIHAIPQGIQRRLLIQLSNQASLRGIIAMTALIKEDLEAIGICDRIIKVFPDGVDLERFSELPEPSECRKSLKLPLDVKFVGYIGRFHTMNQEKGISTLIDAVAMLHTKYRLKAHLLCVGGPLDMVSTYIERASSQGLSSQFLHFVDHQPFKEVPVWLKACDVVTLPFLPTRHMSRYASPMKLFEYMASGTPIVASDLPSLREVLRNGENALLVNSMDADDFASAFYEIFTHESMRQRLVATASQEVVHYTWRERANKILEWLIRSDSSTHPKLL